MGLSRLSEYSALQQPKSEEQPWKSWPKSYKKSLSHQESGLSAALLLALMDQFHLQLY